MIKDFNNNNVKIKSYKVNSTIYNGFYIDVINDGKYRNVWLYHKDHWKKEQIVGCPITWQGVTKSETEFFDDLKLWLEDSIHEYIEDYYRIDCECCDCCD